MKRIGQIPAFPVPPWTFYLSDIILIEKHDIAEVLFGKDKVMICPNCHAEVSDSMKFCENCGSALPASSEQPPEAFSPNADQQQIPSQPESHMRTTDPYANAQHFDQQPYGSYDNTQQYGQQPPSDYGNSQPFEQQPPSDYGNSQPFGQQPANQPYSAPPMPGAYTPTGAGSPQPSSAPFVLSIIALVTSLLGLFPVSIILAIIALVMNSGQKKRGELSTKQSSTTIMSIISLVISAIMLILTIMVGGFVAAYVASEGLSSGSGRTGISQTSPKSSSASAGAVGSAVGSSASSTNNQSGLNPEVVEKLQGTWKLTGLVSNGEITSPEDIEQMQNMGLTVELVLGVDGSASFTLFGSSMNGTWESSDGRTVVLMLEGGRIDASVTDEVIYLIDGNDELSFTKQ